VDAIAHFANDVLPTRVVLISRNDALSRLRIRADGIARQALLRPSPELHA